MKHILASILPALIDAAAAQPGVKFDAQVAAWVGVRKTRVYEWRNGVSAPDMVSFARLLALAGKELRVDASGQAEIVEIGCRAPKPGDPWTAANGRLTTGEHDWIGSAANFIDAARAMHETGTLVFTTNGIVVVP